MYNIEWIKAQVANILMCGGPDDHIDGYEEIADFIQALLEGKGKEWVEMYNVLVRGEKENNWQDIKRMYYPLPIDESTLQPPLQKEMLSKNFIDTINNIEDNLNK